MPRHLNLIRRAASAASAAPTRTSFVRAAPVTVAAPSQPTSTSPASITLKVSGSLAPPPLGSSLFSSSMPSVASSSSSTPSFLPPRNLTLTSSLLRPSSSTCSSSWRSLLPPPSSLSEPTTLGSLRFTTYGQEYQPSQLKRKRKFGFLARLRSKGGRKVLLRRRRKGRRYLSH